MNKKHVSVSLQQAGEEDLLLGKGSQNQTRFSGMRQITKLTIIKPVDNINELKALDTSKYMYAMCVGLYDTEDSNNGYFYYFDPYSEEAESLPKIVSPSTGSGKWKYIPYALDLIKETADKIFKDYTDNELPDIVIEEVTKQAEEIIPEKIDELLETEVPELVKTEVKEVVYPQLVKAGYYDSSLPYKQGHFSDIFLCNTNTNQFKLRRYMLSKPHSSEDDLTPVSGTEASNLNGVKTFYDTDSLNENPLYKRVRYDNTIKQKFDIAGSSPFTFASGTAIKISNKFLGKLKFKLFSSLQVNPACSFELDIYAMSGESQELRFNNVFYSKRLKQLSVTSQKLGILTFGGFCFYTQQQGTEYNVYMYFDSTFKANFTYMYIESEEYFDSTYFTEVKTPDLTLSSNVLTNTTTQIYAVREGGGSDIAELGCIFNSLRFEAVGSESYDYYLFRNGFIPWDENITVQGYYTQYTQEENTVYTSLAVDPSDKYLANVGVIHGTDVGEVSEGQLPNITGSLSTSNGRGWTFATAGTGTGTGAITATNTGQTANAPGESWYQTLNGFTFNASKSNAIYKDSATSVETAHIVTKFCVRGF